MKKIFLPMLLSVSLIFGMAGCGKSASGNDDAAGFTGMSGFGNSLNPSGMSGGDSVDLTGISGGDSANLTGQPAENGSGNRQKVDADFVIVNVPTISYEDFGNGFYDTYLLVPMEKKETGPEISYDEDGLLTSVKVSFDAASDDVSESWLTMEYEKKDGLVTACKISADIYAILVNEYGNKTSDARDCNEYLTENMPMEFVFDSPMEPNPKAVIDEIHDRLVWSGGWGYADYVFPIAFQYLSDIYLDKLSSGEIDAAGDDEDGHEDAAEENKPAMSYDEDGLLTDARGSFAAESGEDMEFWLTLGYEKEDGLVAGCEINADIYSFFVNEFGLDEETAKELNDELMGKMPVKLVFDEPAEVPEAVMELMLAKLEENAESDADKYFLEAFYYFCDRYLSELSSGDTGAANETGIEEIGYTVDLGHGALGEFKNLMNGPDLAFNYLSGGNFNGETKITNDPGWTIDMSVSHEDVICQIETEQDSDGNLTLVHLYNDYASYDYVYTYDGAGRMVRYDHYEYPKGQSREAVGALWYTEYSYDNEGRLTKKQSVSNQDNGVNSSTEFYYDNAGRVIARVDTTDFFGSDYMTIQQKYDSITQSYEYDGSGKVDCVTITVDWAQTIIQSEPVEPTTVLYIPTK